MIEAKEQDRHLSDPKCATDEALSAIAEEMATYRARVHEWLPDREGQFVLIKGSEVVGFFPNQSEALREGNRRFGVVSFLVRRVAAKEPSIYLPNVAL